MQAEPGPAEHFDSLFQRADAARQHDEGVALVEHALFSCVHVVDDFVRDILKDALFLQQEARHDAEHFAAIGMSGAGTGAHQADPAAAIDEANILLGQGTSQILRQTQIIRLHIIRGATIHANRLHSGHSSRL